MGDYALLVMYFTLFIYKLLFGFLGWEYLFSRCQLVTNNSTLNPYPANVEYRVSS